jgi:hypothetical protein
MSVARAALIAALTGLAIVTLGDLFSEEVRGRLDRLPHALIHLVGRRLADDIRNTMIEEWTGELSAMLHSREADALPITRLIISIRYALGLFWATVALNSLQADLTSCGMGWDGVVRAIRVSAVVILAGAVLLLIVLPAGPASPPEAPTWVLLPPMTWD